jgi:eukaryotic-like serine/threonine-protein kinase
VLPPDHPSLALSLNNEGNVLGKLDRLEEAESLLRQALAIWVQVLGPEHSRVGIAYFNLAGLLEERGRFEEADSLYRVTIAIDRKAYGDDHPEVGWDLRRLGVLLRHEGDCEAAVEVLGEADAIFRKNEMPPSHRRRLAVAQELGICLTALGDYERAEDVLLGSYEAAAATDEGAAAAGELREKLTALYEAWGRTADAEEMRSRLANLGP